MTTRPSTPPRARSSRRSRARALGSSGRCHCRRRRTSTASSVRRTSTRTAASTSRCGPTSGSSTFSTRRRRRSTRSCASTCRPRSTSTSSKRRSEPMANDKTGILGEKLGMTQVFDENNRIVPVTVVKAGPCVVTQIRTQEKDGYTAVQLAYGQIDPRKVTKPVAGHFKAANVTPRRHLVELRTESIDGYTVGDEIGAEVFADGARVDVTGTTKGKGTAGVMKRHGFAGVSASH